MDLLNKINTLAIVWLALLGAPCIGYADSEIDTMKAEIDQLKRNVAAANEWRNPNSLFHMAGYADAGYVKSDTSGDNGSFGVGSFSPIFHYQYRDLVMMEAELEMGVGDEGTTDVNLEYMSIDWFANDYLIIVAGKFLSPIGQFRQNLHPSWINKLPSAPVGFGHDGAAPVSDIGVQARGGFFMGNMKATYAIYIGNGPELKAGIEPVATDSTLIDAVDLDGVEAEALGADRDGKKVVGGRFSILPVANLEIGVSVLTGKATVTSFEPGEFTGTDPSLLAEPTRDYDVVGADFSWRTVDSNFRAEYVNTKVAEAAASVATDSAEWSSWYAQYAYQFLNADYEAVLRYCDFDSPDPAMDQKQVAIGLNRLFSNNFIGKIAYESNDNPNTGMDIANRLLLQLSYGF